MKNKMGTTDSQPWREAVSWQDGEKPLAWLGDVKGTCMDGGIGQGFIIVTNQRILFVRREGMIRKSYRFTCEVNLTDIVTISHSDNTLGFQCGASGSSHTLLVKYGEENASEIQKIVDNVKTAMSTKKAQEEEREEESREREKQEKLTQAYHEELITGMYNPWCQDGIEGRGSLAGYPPTQNQPGYVWIPIGFELELNSDPKTHPELPMIRDALAHLDDETSKARKKLWDGMTDYNDSVRALARWPHYVAKVIDHECGLREVTGINQSPQESECNISVLIEYFDHHFFRRENATIGPPFKDARSSSGLTFLPVHYAGHDRTLASSMGDSELAKLMKRIDPWGEYYADARRGLDSKRELLSANLRMFQSGIVQLIQTLRFRPHLVKGKCSIEESFAEGKSQNSHDTRSTFHEAA